MKKALSILLVVVMILALGSFAACTKEEAKTDTPATTPETTTPETTTPPADTETPVDEGTTETVSIGGIVDVAVVTAADGTVTYNGKTEADLDAALPRELVAEKLAAGREVLFAYCLNEFTGDDVTKRVNGLCAAMEALGFTTGTSDAGQDAATEITQIENFVTMGAAYIQCVVASIASFEDVSKLAMEAGTYIGYWGQTPKFENVAGVYSFDQKALGNQQGTMASAWVDMMWPDAGTGEVHAALLGNERNDDVTLRTRSIEETFLQNPKCQITYYVIERMSIDAAYTAAEEALTTDPSIKVFLTFAPSQGIACTQYLMAQAQGGLDLSQYGVFSCTEDATMTEMISASLADPASSPMRGTVGYASENLWDGEYELVTSLLFKGAEPTHYVYEGLADIKGF